MIAHSNSLAHVPYVTYTPPTVNPFDPLSRFVTQAHFLGLAHANQRLRALRHARASLHGPALRHVCAS